MKFKKHAVYRFLIFAFFSFFCLGINIQAEDTPETHEDIENTTVVNIEKQDENGKALTGAHLQVLDDNNQIKEDWISDGTAHASALPAGHYTIHETWAPEGFEQKQTDTAFHVDPVPEDPTDYYGYQLWGIQADYSYRIKTSEQSRLDGTIVYCINHERSYPGLNEPENQQYCTIYKKEPGTSNTVKNNVSVLPTDTQWLKERIKAVLYYGYGYDALHFQNQFHLSSYRFRAVTQAAMYYFTNNESTNIPDTPGTHGSYTVYHALISGDLSVPSNVRLYVY